ncbi:protein of unknown function [Streptomyces murinus]
MSGLVEYVPPWCNWQHCGFWCHLSGFESWRGSNCQVRVLTGRRPLRARPHIPQTPPRYPAAVPHPQSRRANRECHPPGSRRRSRSG